MTEDCYDFEYVRDREYEAIERARKDIVGSSTGKDDLFGLAFSGGGIRSATFNLGVLQGLSRAKLLQQVDYLSTVSGGGYIGSWLSAWIWREGGDVAAVEQALDNPADQKGVEPRPVVWLRQNSSYVAARVGLFSSETLEAFATYVQTLLFHQILNQALLLSMLGVMLMCPLLLAWLVNISAREVSWAILGILALTVAAIFITLNLCHRELRPGNGAPVFQEIVAIIILIVLPLIVGGAALGLAVAELNSISFYEFLQKYWALVFGFTIFVPVVTRLAHNWRNGHAAVLKFGWDVKASKGPTEPTAYRYSLFDLARIVASIGVAVAVGLAGFWLFRQSLPSAIIQIGDTAPDAAAILHATVWAMPAAMVSLGLSTVFCLGIAGRAVSEETRIWWSHIAMLVQGYLLIWILLSCAAIYGPYLVGQLGSLLEGVGLALVLTTAAGVISGRSRFSLGADAKLWVGWVARTAPYVYIGGLLLLIATVLNLWLTYVGAGTSVSERIAELRLYSSFEIYAESLVTLIAPRSGKTLLLVMGILTSVVVLFAFTLDYNVFSLRRFYRNRLMRCYLGASNDSAGTRHAHPLTGYDPADSPKMNDLAEQRPYHIINTALNITRQNLAGPQRKIASFVIAPLYCGYDLEARTQPRSGKYQPTARYLAAAKGWLTLGTALTISGAAQSPITGYRTSWAMALLLAVFDVRLGWWMQNTRSSKDWGRKGPRFGVLWIIYELLTLTYEERRFVYLSDGGHFENLGIYELAKRRCRFIIAVDAGCDPDYTFADLGNAVRKCQVDLGVRIEIDTRALIPDKASGRSLFHCAVGEIHYPANPSGERHVGLLLYVKPSLTGKEPADIAQYAAAHPDFPHQTTSDQRFDESQFESYRNLGQHVTSTILESVHGSIEPEWIFQNLKERWCRPATAAAGASMRHTDQLNNIQEILRNDNNLAILNAQLIPEWSRLLDGTQPLAPVQLGLPADSGQRRAGLYVCTSMLRLMETVYRDLNLEEEWNHPDHRGWMNLFRHWSWSGMFMATFSVGCGMIGARFQRWCERRLDLWPGEVTTEVLRIPDNEYEIIASLQEWEKEGQINFVELSELSAERNGSFTVVKPGDSLVLLRMDCRPKISAPEHRGSTDGELISFTFGIAVVSKSASDMAERNYPDALVYFRIKDDMRRMGLARRAMRELVHGGKVTVNRVCWPEDGPNKFEIERIFNSVKKEHPDLRKMRV